MIGQIACQSSSPAKVTIRTSEQLIENYDSGDNRTASPSGSVTTRPDYILTILKNHCLKLNVFKKIQ